MDFIPVNEPDLSGNEKKYVDECIDTGWISSEGPFVERFESGMAELTRRKHAFAVCNGTAALELAVKAIGIQPGDEVIIPSFTIISCALAVIRAGATPVYVDADSRTWNMQVDLIKPLITEKTKAIMAVHIYGLTADMDPLLEIARKHDLLVIEDAAEAIGQSHKGKPCGSFGDISTFSFYPNKHVTTGEGGMVLVNCDQLADRCKSLRNLCFGKIDRFVHKDLGWNFRMSNLQAAVGFAQLERLKATVDKKRKIGKYYLEAFKGNEFFQLPLLKTEYCENIFWVFGIISKVKNRSAKYYMSKLGKICGTRPFFYPLHLQPALSVNGRETPVLPVSEYLAEHGFYLPSSTNLSIQTIQYLFDSILKASKY
jgi:perosamine synthetase